MPARILLIAAAALLALPAAAQANHAWFVNGKAVHWASTTKPTQIDLGDNLNDPVWDSQRYVPSFYWSATPVLRVYTRTAQQPSNEVEMYDGFYGRNGWIGQATLRSIDSQGHIRDADIQLNRSYALSEGQKHAAINHEVGHTLGLAHQAGTVMCPVLCGIENPVQHDYDVIHFINYHTDSYGTVALRLRAPTEVGTTVKRRYGSSAVIYIQRLRDRTVRVRFRDYISARAAAAALRR